MGVGYFLEPAMVVGLLFGGAWVNRTTSASSSRRRPRRSGFASPNGSRGSSIESIESGTFSSTAEKALLDSESSRSSSPLSAHFEEETWRQREVGLLGWTTTLSSPNTAVFRDRLLSRLLRKFPFLVECWYWALVYWTYQLGRAFTAVTLKQGTVHVARKHALQLIEIEKRWHIFWEVPIQQFFMRRPLLMTWINWTYSFIHIPGTIAFLVWLYYYTITRNRLQERQAGKARWEVVGSPSGPALYQARRRTMAVCNLLAFIVFTLWPCMPPRLLSDTSVLGPSGDFARSFGFVDTVHGVGGTGSVWTENRFCNQYAAMPSLHFGYSLMIGLTIASIPLAPQHRRARSLTLPGLAPRIRLPSTRRALCLALGFLYPFTILVAIVATANHFILDAVAGSMVCGLGWWGNGILLNLVPLEDCLLCALRIHKPDPLVVEVAESGYDSEEEFRFGKGVLGY